MSVSPAGKPRQGPRETAITFRVLSCCPGTISMLDSTVLPVQLELLHLEHAVALRAESSTATLSVTASSRGHAALRQSSTEQQLCAMATVSEHFLHIAAASSQTSLDINHPISSTNVSSLPATESATASSLRPCTLASTMQSVAACSTMAGAAWCCWSSSSTLAQALLSRKGWEYPSCTASRHCFRQGMMYCHPCSQCPHR